MFYLLARVSLSEFILTIKKTYLSTEKYAAKFFRSLAPILRPLRILVGIS